MNEPLPGDLPGAVGVPGPEQLAEIRRTFAALVPDDFVPLRENRAPGRRWRDVPQAMELAADLVEMTVARRSVGDRHAEFTLQRITGQPLVATATLLEEPPRIEAVVTLPPGASAADRRIAEALLRHFDEALGRLGRRRTIDDFGATPPASQGPASDARTAGG